MLLVDLDGVAVEFTKGLLDEFKSKYPEYQPTVEVKDYVTFEINGVFREPYVDKVYDIIKRPGFFFDLKPKHGAVPGLKRLRDAIKSKFDGEVFLCTTPFQSSETCAMNKLQWVEKYFDKSWVKRTILTHDKTLVQGAFLIDDKPDIKGLLEPTWKQIVFSTPYNQNMDESYLRIDDWSDYSLDVVLAAMKKANDDDET